MQEKEMQTAQNEEQVVESQIYKCPSCGNFLYYDPQSQKLKCEYCGTEKELEPVAGAVELDYHSGVENGFVPWSGVKNVKCRSCGAITVLSDYETVSKCPFCNASNIVEENEIEGLQPNGVLPFRISKDQVHNYYLKWLKTKYLAPFKLKKEAKKQPSNGVYIPLFTFDTNCFTSYTIRYGKHYTVTVGSGKNRRTETRTRWYIDSGNVSNFFNDVQVEASKTITQQNLQKLGGFDTDNCKAYHNQYLSGYSAERYDKGLDNSWGEALNIIDQSMRNQIISMYNADVVDYVNMNSTHTNTKYKYVLVPIWVFCYKYRNKTYGCIANGRTGRIVGKYPKSPAKITTIALVAAGLVGLLIWLYINYFA